MWNYITELYDEQIEKAQDPRIKGWPLMDSPRTTLILVALYVIFVKFVGPAYMRNRKPMEIKNLIIAYNAFQTVYSVTVCILSMFIWVKLEYNFICVPQSYRTDEYASLAVLVCWLFYVARFTEFMDTIFFVLRKKDNQVTLLHVYHHATVPICLWIGVKIVPGGHWAISGMLNAFVHCFMYSYYLLASLGPQYKKYLWWKRYMTILQLAQFVIVIIHTIWTLASGCPVNKLFGYLVLFQAIFFYKMFWDFYKEAFKVNQIKQK